MVQPKQEPGFWWQVTHSAEALALWFSALLSQIREGHTPYTASPPPRHTKSCLTMAGGENL